MPEFRGRLIPQDSRSLRVFTVPVPDGATRIVIDLTYEPRTVEDRQEALGLVQRIHPLQGLPYSAEDLLAHFWPLRNLLNVTAFEPGGRFRGRWDRNRPGQSSAVVIADQDSSPGMVDGPLHAGTWQVCLEVHQVLAPVAYALRVEAQKDAPRMAAVHHRPISRSPRGAATPQDEARGAWLRGELHTHSDHSDGRQPVAEVIGALRREGLDFIALTDHNTVTGLRDIPADGFLGIPGFELTTFWGHATCLGVSAFTPWYDGERPRPFREIARDVHASGGLICVAHPFSPPNPLCAGCRWEFPQFEWQDADLLEIWNGDQQEHAALNAAALELWDRLLNSGRRIPAVAGSDLHDVTHLASKRYARTFVRAAGRSVEAVLDAIRGGRVIISAGPFLRLHALLDARTYEIGDTVAAPPGSTILLQGSVDAPASVRVQLVVGGRRIEQAQRWDYAMPVDASTWVRAEARLGQTLLAVTNPIYIDVVRDS